MAKVWLVSVVLVICAIAAVESANAPAPSVDCSSLVLNMADCLSYLSKGSNETKPVATCCSGFKTVYNTNPECLCEAFKDSAQYGIDLDMDKATKLPAACGVHNVSASQCQSTPGTAPAKSPTGTPPATAPSPATSGGTAKAPATAPAPAPKAASASSVSIPFVLLFSAVVASCSFI